MTGSRPPTHWTPDADDPHAFRRLYSLIQRVAATSGTLTALEAFERWRGLLRTALSHMPNGSGSEAPDAAFYDRFRAALLAAGALEADLDLVGQSQVMLVVDHTVPDSEEREQQFELIARHLVYTEMTVHVSPGDANIRVEFPDRPTRQ